MSRRVNNAWRVCILLLLFLAKHGNAARSAEDAASPAESDGNVLPARSSLDIETRRYLLYLYARLNKPRMAESLSEAILNERPADKQTLLVLASMYIERHEPEKALKTARRLIGYYPGDHQALYFLGAAHYAAGQYESSREVFRELKDNEYAGRLYPYETDLASAALRAEDWFGAMLAYQELLRRHQLSEELRLEVRKVLEGIYRKHLPQFEAEARTARIESGEILRTRLTYGRHLTDSHWIEVSLHQDKFGLEAQGIIRSRSTARTEGKVAVRTAHSRKWSSEVAAGGSGSGPLGGFKLTRVFGTDRTLTFFLDANERATDSLLIESLDGRQHRAGVEAIYRLTSDWSVSGSVAARVARLGGTSIGHGVQGEARIEKVWVHGAPEIRTGYRAYWMRFDQETEDAAVLETALARTASAAERTSAMASLVMPELHRHGVYGVWQHDLSGALKGTLSAGVDYAIDRASFEYQARAGVSFFPRKSIELRGEAGYASSATTSDSASDLVELLLALRVWF